NTYLRDLERFIALVEHSPEKKSLFAPYYIFKGESGWYTPGAIYLDSPYKDTDLSAYYTRMGEDAKRFALHDRYKQSGMPIERLAKFAQVVGARVRLVPEQGHSHANPQWAYLKSVGVDRYTS